MAFWWGGFATHFLRYSYRCIGAMFQSRFAVTIIYIFFALALIGFVPFLFRRFIK